VAVVEPDGPDRALMTVGADNLRWMAGHLVALPWDFEVLEPGELRALLLEVGRRLTRAHRKGGRPAVR
jgi:predicted DNA-binding transcriptional regulator YafY